MTSWTKTVLRYKTKLTILLVSIIVEMVLLISLAVYCAYLGSQVYSECTFLEISTDGTAMAVDDERKLLEDWSIPVKNQEKFLKTFIQSLREVPEDSDKYVDNISTAVYRTAGQAYTYVANYLTENNPSVVAEEQYVEVPLEHIELTQYQGGVWKIVWREKVTDSEKGTLISDRQYEMVVYTTVVEELSDEVRKYNPLGIFITYIDSDLVRSYS